MVVVFGVIAGGANNCIHYASHSTIAGGNYNCIYACCTLACQLPTGSFIGGGTCNRIIQCTVRCANSRMCYDVIAGGHCNQIFAQCAYTCINRSINTIGGGLCNCLGNGMHNFIGRGS